LIKDPQPNSSPFPHSSELPMKSRWSDAEAADYVARYREKGVGEDLALRVYTTRLLGNDPKLVLHGGGNTSVKTHLRDQIGDEAEVICVKVPAGTWATSSRPACPPCALSRRAACARWTSCPTKTW